MRNRYAYLFAAMPLFVMVAEVAADWIYPDNHRQYVLPVAVATWFGYGILASLDANELARAGHNAIRRWYWLFVPPVYLWKRARQLGQRRTMFWLWLACLVTTGVIHNPVSEEVLLFGPRIPACGSGFADREVRKIVDNSSAARQIGMVVLALDHPVGTMSEQGRRACEATIIGSDGHNYPVAYQFHLMRGGIRITVQMQTELAPASVTPPLPSRG